MPRPERPEEPKRNDYEPCSCGFEAEVECGGCEEYSHAQSSYWREVDKEIDEERDVDLLNDRARDDRYNEERERDEGRGK